MGNHEYSMLRIAWNAVFAALGHGDSPLVSAIVPGASQRFVPNVLNMGPPAQKESKAFRRKLLDLPVQRLFFGAESSGRSSIYSKVPRTRSQIYQNDRFNFPE
jgi:hypothetical protein